MDVNAHAGMAGYHHRQCAQQAFEMPFSATERSGVCRYGTIQQVLLNYVQVIQRESFGWSPFPNGLDPHQFTRDCASATLSMDAYVWRC
jgi:hypothetical protein